MSKSKIGIYSDVHISHTSSILPLYLDKYDDLYTTRLSMCKKSINWAYKIFKEQNVDYIVNCGDTFNSHTLYSDEISAFTDIKDIMHLVHSEKPGFAIHLIGNHDKFNDNFSSINMLKLIPNNFIVDKYFYRSIDDIDIYAISYFNVTEFNELILEMMEKYPRSNKKSILFMHGDINGSYLSGIKKIENHISTELLTKYFDIVINGHIHCHEKIYDKNNRQIYNIGSLTTHSFADSDNHIAACYVLDTKNMSITQFENPYQILFKSYEIKNIHELKDICDSLNNNYNYILKIKCPFNVKSKAESVLNQYMNIIKYKFVFIYNKDNMFNKSVNINKTNSINDLQEEFIRFISNRDDLKADVNQYNQLIMEKINYD